MDQFIYDFNNTACDLCDNIALACPTSLIGRNIKEVKKALQSKMNKNKFIDMFVLNVLVHKNEIMAGNDSFFLKKSYDNEIDKQYSSSIFEFKDIWVKLSPQNKNVIIQYMQILCMLAEEYKNLVMG